MGGRVGQSVLLTLHIYNKADVGKMRNTRSPGSTTEKEIKLLRSDDTTETQFCDRVIADGFFFFCALQVFMVCSLFLCFHFIPFYSLVQHQWEFSAISLSVTDVLGASELLA